MANYNDTEPRAPEEAGARFVWDWRGEIIWVLWMLRGVGLNTEESTPVVFNVYTLTKYWSSGLEM